MKKLNYNEFSNYFYTTLVPKIKPLEFKRKLLIGIAITIFFIGIMVAGKFAILFMQKNVDNFWGPFTCVLGGFVACTYLPCYFLNLIYKNNVKRNLYKTFFETFGLNYTRQDVCVNDVIGKICSTGIYDGYNKIDTDDVISGYYNGIPFILADTKITYEQEMNDNKMIVTIFNGLFVSTKINKNFNGETLIKTEQVKQPKAIRGKNVVRLEDVEFEKYFEVYGTDQVEARYLLTTAFMNRLMEYKKKKKCKIEVVFSNEFFSNENTSDRNLFGGAGIDNADSMNNNIFSKRQYYKDFLNHNIFFFVPTNKNHFEIPITKSLLNVNIFYDIVTEITDIIEIVEALKLDQNIGM